MACILHLHHIMEQPKNWGCNMERIVEFLIGPAFVLLGLTVMLGIAMRLGGVL